MSNPVKYEIDGATVEKLFGPISVRYEIPRFQRPFSWNNTQITNFITDIVKDENWVAYSKQKAIPAPYFLGAVVLSRTESGAMQVLDGQQRFTTISLLLLALRNKLKKFDVEQQISTLRNCLSSTRMMDDKPTPKLVLQGDDNAIYECLLEDKTQYYGPDQIRSRLVKAYGSIETQVDEFINDQVKGGLNEKSALLALADKVLVGITFVQIVAPTEGDAFTLFETLNDRGLPLSGADLIKNKMLAKSAGPGRKKAFDEIADLWDEMVSAVGDNEAVNYLRYFWLAFHATKETTKAGLYNDYNRHIESLDIAALRHFAKDLRDAANVYSSMVAPEDGGAGLWGEDVNRALIRLNAYRARTCRPLLLLGAVRNKNNFAALVQTIESATVRAIVIGEKNPNVLDKAYTDLCISDREASAAPHHEQLFERLNAYVPSDDEFQKKFVESDASSGLSTVWRNILLRLNEEISGGEAKLYGSRLVHVEHVLPQTLNPATLAESKFESEKHALEFVGKVGNLTLLNGKRNSSLSNKPYSEKVSTYVSSDVALTREIARNYTFWTESEILNRTRVLSDLALKAWRWGNN